MFIDTVDSIMSGFTKTINKLDALITKNSRAIETNNAAVEKIVEDSKKCKTEMDKASSIKTKLEQLLA